MNIGRVTNGNLSFSAPDVITIVLLHIVSLDKTVTFVKTRCLPIVFMTAKYDRTLAEFQVNPSNRFFQNNSSIPPVAILFIDHESH